MFSYTHARTQRNELDLRVNSFSIPWQHICMPCLLYRRINQQVALKRRDPFNEIHHVTPQKRVIFTLSQ